MRSLLQLGVAAVLLAGVGTTPAFAGDETRARAAVAAAQGRIDAATSAGAGNSAGDILARARAAAAVADRAVKRNDDEDRALHAANEASALADLAIVTAELKSLEGQRDQLRAAAK